MRLSLNARFQTSGFVYNGPFSFLCGLTTFWFKSFMEIDSWLTRSRTTLINSYGYPVTITKWSITTSIQKYTSIYSVTKTLPPVTLTRTETITCTTSIPYTITTTISGQPLTVTSWKSTTFISTSIAYETTTLISSTIEYVPSVTTVDHTIPTTVDHSYTSVSTETFNTSYPVTVISDHYSTYTQWTTVTSERLSTFTSSVIVPTTTTQFSDVLVPTTVILEVLVPTTIVSSYLSTITRNISTSYPYTVYKTIISSTTFYSTSYIRTTYTTTDVITSLSIYTTSVSSVSRYILVISAN